MKILVISDTHLTDKFDNKKYNLLARIITQADRVIINGDFWDGYLTAFDEFVKSPWKRLFPLLKSKNTIYLFGNHDKKQYADNRLNLFSDKQQFQFLLKTGNKQYIFEHGDRIAPALDSKIPRKIMNFYLTTLANIIGIIFIKILKKDPLLKFMSEKENEQIIRVAMSAKNTIYVCGHTHSPVIDLNHSYINSGFINYGKAFYVMITNDHIELKEEWYA